MQRFLDRLSRLQQRHALLLFLALGAALFTAEGLRRPTPTLAAPGVVGAGASAQQWLEEEVLYREALARGLDEGDLIVRRRLAQKMRLLLETSVDVPEPDTAQLRAWIDAHPARYGGLEHLSLSHVFLSRSLRGTQLGDDAVRVAAQLRSGAVQEIERLGDPHPGGTQLQRVTHRELERLFGTPVTAQLLELPVGSWEGPIASAFGIHFVYVRQRQLGTPDYAAVHDRAQRDFLIEQRRIATAVALTDLKARYGLSERLTTP